VDDALSGRCGLPGGGVPVPFADHGYDHDKVRLRYADAASHDDNNPAPWAIKPTLTLQHQCRRLAVRGERRLDIY
jgi:hypothetical protein